MKYVLKKQIPKNANPKLYEDSFKIQQEFCQDQENRNYILGIDHYKYDTQQNIFIITYNCSENAKSLQQLKFDALEDKEKFNIFDQLFKLAEFLKSKSITHNNIKLSNLILDNNTLYLTDFGYLKSKNCPNIFMDELNFVKRIKKDQKRQIYPYLTKDFLENLKTDEKNYEKNSENNVDSTQELLQKLKKRTQKEIQENDQHALTVMMLEIFYQFDNSIEYNIQNCFQLSKRSNRKQQIDWIKLKNPQMQDYILFIIQQILLERFNEENQLIPDFPKSLSISIVKIDRERLTNNENKELVKDYLINQDFEFDLQLLYLFNQEELKKILTHVQNKQKEFDNQLKIEINRILTIFKNIDDKQFNQNDFRQLKLEDQFISLVYLDEQIGNFKIVKNQDNLFEQKQLLNQYTQKQELIEFYDQINKKQQNDFIFNLPINKRQRRKSSFHQPIVSQKKIDRERLTNNENKELVKAYLINEDVVFDLQLLYLFNQEELKITLIRIQNSEFDKQLKLEINRILSIYKKIDNKQFNQNDFRQLKLEDQFISLVYLDQKIENLNENTYHAFKQQLIEFYDQINNKQQKDFIFNLPINLRKMRKLSQELKNGIVKIDRERLKNNENKELVKDYLINEDFEFDLQLLYLFTQEELKKTLTHVQNKQKEFDKQLKIEINRILKIYKKIDDKQFNQNDFRQLKLEDQFISLVYLDQKIENLNENTYDAFKQELIEFYDQINNKQQNDFNFNHPISINYMRQLLHHQEYNEFLQEYINLLKFEMLFDKRQVDYINKDQIIIKFRNKGDQKITYKQINKNNDTIKRIIHEIYHENGQYSCKHLQIIVFNRHFQPLINITFDLIKEFIINQSKKVKQIDYKNKFLYQGDYFITEEENTFREIIFNGEGTLEILSQYLDTLQNGQVYKVEGTFRNNMLDNTQDGKEIKTYYYNLNQEQITFSKGSYQKGKMCGKHEHYLVSQENIKVKTTHHFPKFFQFVFEIF